MKISRLLKKSRVSNPLRLKGDEHRRAGAMSYPKVFLIHYGWRGTAGPRRRRWFSDLVSNPLRLEGDRKPCDVGDRIYVVSNPLRLEGDFRYVPTIVPKRSVSNPLRLEGDFG